MGKQVLLNVGISVNGVDLSDHAHTCTVADTAAQVDLTAFGGNGYQQYGRGLKDATITVDFFSDYAASSVHSTLSPLYTSGTAFALTVIPDSTVAVSATNPRGSMLASLYDYSPVSGQVGNAATFTATFRNAGSGITWGTA
jgi:hypothetical protein